MDTDEFLEMQNAFPVAPPKRERDRARDFEFSRPALSPTSLAEREKTRLRIFVFNLHFIGG